MKKNNKKFFIEALEQRIMLDGAGASTFIDTLEDTVHNKFSLNNESKVNKFVESANKDSDVKLPFINQTRDQKRNELRQIVFIDTQVEDYQQLIRAFDKNTEIHLIQSNENGFDKINQTLKGYKNIDSLHIIGHGSAGQILFGDALLSNDTFNQYSKTLKSIGNNLSPSGDILFYGCSIASNERGLSLINKISEITKADIAASDDITGKGGDWHLEKNIGNIETKNINQTDYQHDLEMYRTASAATTAGEITVGADGITSIRGAMSAFTGTADRNAFDFKASRDHYANPNGSGPFQDHYLTYDSGTFGTGDKNDSDGVNRFTVVLEQTGITSGNIIARRADNPGAGTITESDWNGNTYRRYISDNPSYHHYEIKATRSSPDADEGPLDVYMAALDSHFGNNDDRYNKIAQVVFDREIVGILIGNNETTTSSSSLSNIDIDLHNSNNSTYPNAITSNREFETIQWRSFQNTYGSSDWGYGTNTGGDWFAVGGTDNKTLHIAAKNTGGGDYARILVKGNVPPVAQNDVGVIVENGTLTVSDGANANVSGSYDATGEHSGDVLTTNSGSHADTDADSDTLVVSAVRVGSSEGSGTAGTLGQALTGTYGQLTLNANGSYSYVANQDAAEALDSGDTATDVFNYTVSDGNGGTDTATITITILGANDAPVAQNDVGVIVENGTLTVSDGANANVSGSYDATGEHTGDVIHTSLSGSRDTDVDGDDTANLVVSAVRVGSSEGSGTAGTLGQALTGTYGQLTLNANGSYSYVANQDAAEALDSGDTATDVFNYTVSDGNGGTDTATITITILGANDAPVAQNDVGVIVENGTLTVSDGANANVSGSYDATGEHTGDVIHTSLSGSRDTDVDGDDTANLVVSAVRVGSSEGSGTAGTLGQALTGTYGQLTLNANGSYSYVANQDAAEALDSGDTATDVFNYTVSDGNGGTDTATITITILGANDAPVAQNDVGVIVENGTLTVSDGANANLSGSYDATGEHSGDVINTSSSSHSDSDLDDSASLNITQIKENGGSNSAVSSGSSYNSSGTSVTGTYGTLTIGADGSYTYIANTAAAEALDAGDTANDVFHYIVSDGTATDTATITITILGANDAPVAQNDVGVIVEDGTLTVANGANANVSGSYDATGEHTGDVIHTSLSGSKDTDIDGDDTANLVVSAVRVGSSEGSGTPGTVGQALTGTYGQLTLNTNGSYSYVANQDAADALDAGDTATDVFNYTISDGSLTDTATITITILGTNDAPVAQNDVGVIDKGQTLTVSDGANANPSGSYDATGENSGDVLQTSSSSHKDNDADGDDPANLVVSAVRVGSSEGSGTAGTLGQALTGTYGQLTLNANGSYSYVANQDAAEALDSGDTATDVFNYTVSDGNGGTDTATITITILGATDAPTSTNTTVYKEVKEEGKKKSKQDIRRERRQERKAEKIAAKKFELPESSDKKFNQGLKLVDLVAESNSEDGLSLKFKVFNDEGKEVQKYYGIMKDGSELPAWITVDSKTGKASTDIPKDINLLEFKIIAVDTDNNKKQVTVIIDPEKISQDKDIMKQVKIKNSSNITVNNNGLVELNTTNEDGLTIKTATDAVNQNKSFKDIVNSIEANEEFKIQSESRDFNSDFIFKLENILEPNFDKIKLVLKNGSEIPSWILFDEATGKITANPPAGIEALDFKIIIEDTDGVVTVKDLEIDFIKNDNNTLLDIEETEKNFVSFNQQLIIESDNLDNYGEKLINNL